MSGLAWHSPVDLLGELAPAIRVGRFRTGENAYPHYQIIAVTDDRTWIRDFQHGTDHVVPVDQYRKIKDGGE